MDSRFRVTGGYFLKEGINAKYDRILKGLRPRNLDGSGAGFGQRDFFWYFVQKPAAERLLKELKRKKWVSTATFMDLT